MRESLILFLMSKEVKLRKVSQLLNGHFWEMFLKSTQLNKCWPKFRHNSLECKYFLPFCQCIAGFSSRSNAHTDIFLSLPGITHCTKGKKDVDIAISSKIHQREGSQKRNQSRELKKRHWKRGIKEEALKKWHLKRRHQRKGIKKEASEKRRPRRGIVEEASKKKHQRRGVKE